MPLSPFAKTFATSEHPIYKRLKDRWELQETMLRGGPEVRDKVIPFAWEKSDPDHLKARKQTASYINFAERMVGRFVGHLDAERPTPGSGANFDAVGGVRGEDELTGDWTKGEYLWYDVDAQGTPLALFTSEAHKRAVATGHRWLVAEMTADAPESAADEAAGLRPYAVEYSPLDVPNWRYVNGHLAALVTRSAVESLVTAEGEYADEPVTVLALYVAAGPQAAPFGQDAVASGAWIVLGEDGEPLLVDGKPLEGTLESTLGEIPAVPLLYRGDERDFSVSGTEDLNAIALSYLSLSSAGDSDALETAARTLFLFNMRTETFNKGAAVKEIGGRIVPFEPSPVGTQGAAPVSYYDSASVSGGEAVEKALERKRREAAEIAADELRAAPTASGEARKVEFVDSKAPRLTTMAYHRERAENELLRLLTLRWGETEAPTLTWPKRFDVADTVDDWLAVFNAASRMQADSPTLTVTGLKRILKAKNVSLDQATWAAIDAEVRAAADARAQAADDLSTIGDPFAQDTQDDAA